jgi:hypothetical protein
MGVLDKIQGESEPRTVFGGERANTVDAEMEHNRMVGEAAAIAMHAPLTILKTASR